MSRYACYLAIQNADPGKEIVALGQTYFAIQTHWRQELSDGQLEDHRRLQLRDELKKHNTQLADAAKDCGVIEPKDYAIFHNHGYQGLYGGMTAQDIHSHKGLKMSQQILDHMGSTELAANLFRAPRPKKNCGETKLAERPTPIALTSMWEKKSLQDNRGTRRDDAGESALRCQHQRSSEAKRKKRKIGENH